MTKLGREVTFRWRSLASCQVVGNRLVAEGSRRGSRNGRVVNRTASVYFEDRTSIGVNRTDSDENNRICKYIDNMRIASKCILYANEGMAVGGYFIQIVCIPYTPE